MNGDPFVLIDRERRRAFGWLAAAHRPLRSARVTTDGAGVTWLWTEVGDAAVGLTWLGPGRVCDAGWVATNGDEFGRSFDAMLTATPARHRAELDAVASQIRTGRLAGRVLYAVHRAVLSQKTSLVTVSDTWLGEMAWGKGRSARPRHWWSVLREILRGLSWLHIADPLPDGGPPAFGAQTVLITHAGDLRGTKDDTCQGDCGARGHACHSHFVIDVGPGFLGLLEQFGHDPDGSGVRTYQFTVSGKRTTTTLRTVGKSGRLASVFVPAVLGEPEQCRKLGESGHRVLQALVRETTRPSKPEPDADPRAEVVASGRLRTYSGRSTVRCELLEVIGPAVGFNGNGKRKAMGFRLAGEWGWLSKADYPQDAAEAFLDDLAGLVDPLGLTVIGVGQGNTFYTLSQLRGMAESARAGKLLGQVDVRVFARPDYARRWSAYFGWEDTSGGVVERPEFDLRAEMRSLSMSCRRLATRVGCDHSFLAKMLSGKKAWPAELLKKVRAFLSGDKPDGQRSGGLVGLPFEPIVRSWGAASRK